MSTVAKGFAVALLGAVTGIGVSSNIGHVSAALAPAVTSDQAETALVTCKKHIHPHINALGESMLYAEGYRHCGILAKMLREQEDHAEMTAPDATAQEAADADMKATRDIVRRLEAK